MSQILSNLPHVSFQHCGDDADKANPAAASALPQTSHA